jgi:hypothetical protein
VGAVRGRKRVNQGIGGERRANRRYAIELPLHWRLIYRRRVVESGIGRTRDISSRGILFESEKLFPEGSQLELSIAWPVILGGAAPLKLMAGVEVLRSNGKLTAVRTMQHEFRTAGVPAQGLAKHSYGERSAGIWNLWSATGVTKLQ